MEIAMVTMSICASSRWDIRYKLVNDDNTHCSGGKA